MLVLSHFQERSRMKIQDEIHFSKTSEYTKKQSIQRWIRVLKTYIYDEIQV